MSGRATVIDAAVRFARTNPELMAYAREAAARTGRSVDELLLDAVQRVRDASPAASSAAAVPQQQGRVAAAHRQQRVLVQ